MQKVVVGLFINTKTAQVLIAKRHSFSPLAGHWEFPGGMLEAGESPQGCLERQIFQLFNANCQALNEFCSYELEYQGAPMQFTALLAQLDEDADLQAQLHEELKWVEIDRLLDYTFVPAQLEIAEKLVSLVK